MRRTTTTVAALALVLVGLLPVSAAADPAAPTTAPATTTTVAAGAPTTTSTAAPAPTSSTTTSVPPATTTSVVPTTTNRRAFAQARAAQTATVSVATSGAGCSTFCFSPTQTTIAAGGTVTFTNPSSADHTVKRCTPSACNGASGGTGNDATFSAMTIALPPNTSAQYTFSQPGTYVYFCTLHGYALMHGTITVAAAEPAPSTTIAAPATAPPSGVTAPTTDPNALASTGGSPDPLIVVAFLLLAVGGAAVALSRRNDAENGR